MHQLTKNRLDWLEAYGDLVQSILHDDSLTRRDKVNKLNKERIPTLRGQIGKWTLANMDQVTKRHFK